jgi:hypothetical protein
MTTNYLLGRQNVIQVDLADLNEKLAAIVEVFNLSWLRYEGDNPLQKLWARDDALATNELLNFGDAVKRLNQENQR